MNDNPRLTVKLAAPRGFCAGVERALRIVELALERWGPPIYVRHDIVHNRRVVDALRDKGVVFVAELDECPDDRPVIFSAHGVAKSVEQEAKRRNIMYINATCPLVAKVHAEARWHSRQGRQIIMIGQEGHAETVGTMGQVAEGEMLLVRSVEEVHTLEPQDCERLAFTTQTTLSVDDATETVAALRTRFPAIVGPRKDDVCYATTNRQNAVKAIAPTVDALFVIGAPYSSNTRHLVEAARRAGCPVVRLVQNANEIDWDLLAGIERLGITASASSPESFVEEVVEAIGKRFLVSCETVASAEESVHFKVPNFLTDSAASASDAAPRA